jgi:hypothetical protein
MRLYKYIYDFLVETNVRKCFQNHFQNVSQTPENQQF